MNLIFCQRQFYKQYEVGFFKIFTHKKSHHNFQMIFQHNVLTGPVVVATRDSSAQKNQHSDDPHSKLPQHSAGCERRAHRKNRNYCQNAAECRGQCSSIKEAIGGNGFFMAAPAPLQPTFVRTKHHQRQPRTYKQTHEAGANAWQAQLIATFLPPPESS